MFINFLFFIQTFGTWQTKSVYQLLLQHVKYMTDTDVIYVKVMSVRLNSALAN